MSEMSDTGVPPELRPRQADLGYDLAKTLTGLVSLRTRIPEDAATARILGTERGGHGVLLDEQGLVLTIGYLVAEAEQAWIVDHRGQAVTAEILAYDYASGFGLLRGLGRLAGSPLQLGSAAALAAGDTVVVAGAGGIGWSLSAKVTALTEFAGYWEYLLERAIFTAPAHPDWGGAALIDAQGHLCGIGSLYLENVVGEGAPRAGNMSVPVDLLAPILEDLSRYGQVPGPARPWLGVFVAQTADALVIGGLYPGGPGAAVLREGDVILALGDTPVRELPTFYRQLWALGEAGVEVPLRISRDRRVLEVRLRSIDRRDAWKKPQVH